MPDRTPAPPTAPPPGPDDLLVRLTPDLRRRIDRAAAATGDSAPGYVRVRALEPGANAPAWRAVHQRVLAGVHAAVEAGLPDGALDALRALVRDVEAITADVFYPDPGAGPGADPGGDADDGGAPGGSRPTPTLPVYVRADLARALVAAGTSGADPRGRSAGAIVGALAREAGYGPG